MKTGIELIAEERKEQIEKHGRTIENDRAQNSDLQLIEAAYHLIGKQWLYAEDIEETCPSGFNEGIEADLNEYHEWCNPELWKQRIEKLKKVSNEKGTV